MGHEVHPRGARVGVGGVARAGCDRSELLLDLGDVPVAAHTVRPDALVDLAEVELRLRLATGP